MKKRNRASLYARAAGARNERGRAATSIDPVEGAAGIRCTVVKAQRATRGVTTGLASEEYGLVPAGTWMALFPRRGVIPKRGQYLLVEPWGGPERFHVETVIPIGGRFDTVVELTETLEHFGPPDEPVP